MFAKLSSASVEGTAHHIVAEFIVTQDGHAAWNALVAWYDGDDVKADVAATIWRKLKGTILLSGGDPNNYINQFKLRLDELNRIQGEGMSLHESKRAFLSQI